MLAAGVDVVRLNFSRMVPPRIMWRVRNGPRNRTTIGSRVAMWPTCKARKFAANRRRQGQSRPARRSSWMPGELGDGTCVGLDYGVATGRVAGRGAPVTTAHPSCRRAVDGPRIVTKVVLGGTLSNNKGINRMGGGLTAPALTAKDMEDMKAAAMLEADFLAVSFPKNKEDMYMARQLLRAAGGRALLIAKIERAEAITYLEEIIEASDGIMVARGDLAVEVGNASVPGLQKRMIKLARERNKLTITATQMMESMILAPVPTRAEVSDVANAVLDGTDAVMLSAETAAGKYPVETVETMAQICLEAEKSARVELDRDMLNRTFTRIDQSIAMATLFTAYHLKAKLLH
jgi:pyruvate kinase